MSLLVTVVMCAVVVGLGKSAVAVADALRAALKHRAQPGVDWEESRVNHLVLVVECSPLNGDSCEAAQKFMRDVRKSDGYPVYSEIIGRKVAILAILVATSRGRRACDLVS